MQYSRYNKKRFKVNLLSNVELEVTPLTQDAEGKLLGGFVGMQGMRVPAEEKNAPCSNSSCSNQGCVNIEYNNNSCKNAPCTNTPTVKPSVSVTITVTVTGACSALNLGFF